MYISADIEAMSDEEFDKLIDKLADDMNGEFKEYENGITPNLRRIRQFKFAYYTLRRIIKGDDVEISYEVCKPSKTRGSIKAEANLLEFDQPEWFARVAEFADSSEIMPFTNNKVSLTFSFHGLATTNE